MRVRPVAARCLLALLLYGVIPVARAAPPPPLTCGVEGESKSVRGADLCAAVGKALKRTVVVVEDARRTHHEAVQIIRGDVQWTVIWLEAGHVRAWTRVSHIEAADQQIRFVVNATEALVKANTPVGNDCVRLDPNGGRRMRSSDLSYPWAELKKCKRERVEVLDPWWLPS